MKQSFISRLAKIEERKNKGRILFKTPGMFTENGRDVWICDGKIIPEPELRENDIVFIDDIDETAKEKFKIKMISRIKAGAKFPEETPEQVERKERVLRKIRDDGAREQG